MALPERWQSELGRSYRFGVPWAGHQPIVELMVACGLGSRDALTWQAHHGMVSYIWAESYEDLLAEDIIRWIPLSPHDLVLPSELSAGVVLFRRGSLLARAILTEDTNVSL